MFRQFRFKDFLGGFQVRLGNDPRRGDIMLLFGECVGGGCVLCFARRRVEHVGLRARVGGGGIQRIRGGRAESRYPLPYPERMQRCRLKLPEGGPGAPFEWGKVQFEKEICIN